MVKNDNLTNEQVESGCELVVQQLKEFASNYPAYKTINNRALGLSRVIFEAVRMRDKTYLSSPPSFRRHLV
jgi:hypothetical protein